MDQLFQIFKLSAEDAREITSSPEEPHDHDFEELIIGIEGELEHFIDFKSNGNGKAGFSVNGKINRKDWGLNWNAALEAGGVLVSDEVRISCEIQLVKQI